MLFLSVYKLIFLISRVFSSYISLSLPFRLIPRLCFCSYCSWYRQRDLCMCIIFILLKLYFLIPVIKSLICIFLGIYMHSYMYVYIYLFTCKCIHFIYKCNKFIFYIEVRQMYNLTYVLYIDCIILINSDRILIYCIQFFR